MAKFSERVKELRRERNLTQEGLARSLELSNVAVSGYERGVRKPSFDILERLAEFFNTDIAYLMGTSDIRRPYAQNASEGSEAHEPDSLHGLDLSLSATERKIITNYRNLDDLGKALVRRAANVEDE